MTGNHEPVEALVRYASNRFSAAGIDFRPSKMSKLIRSRILIARKAIDTYITNEVAARDGSSDHLSWRGFEIYVNGYADPTGAHATRNIAPGIRWQDDKKQWAEDAR